MSILTKVINAQASQDGDGVKIFRLAGRHLHPVMNPFLMIDEINSDEANDYIGGFPEHPHRGFETITYMKAGLMRHRDHMGNEGVIGEGDVQWMTAGAGVLHSEMPEQNQGLLHGFQIWLNLPAAEKMKPAAYNEIKEQTISKQALTTGGNVKIIAGDVLINQQAQSGSMPEMSTKPVFLDVNLVANEQVEITIDSNNPVLVYVYGGASDAIEKRQMGVYDNGKKILLSAKPEGLNCLVFSGEAIKEPIVQYGPFVMNSSEEINQALRDFQDPRFLASLNAQ